METLAIHHIKQKSSKNQKNIPKSHTWWLNEKRKQRYRDYFLANTYYSSGSFNFYPKKKTQQFYYY